MSDQARPWLPPGAAAGDWVRATLEPVLAAWSAHWFATRTFRIGRLAERNAPASGEDRSRRAAQTFAVRSAPAAAIRLAEMALDLHPGSDLTHRDRPLLETFAEALLDDLKVRLEAKFGAAGATAVGGWLEASVCEGVGPDALLLELPMPAVAKAFREAAAAPPDRPALPAFRAALADLPIPLEATMGNLSMSMPDLAALEPGDVLVFSTRIEDPIEVSILGSPKAFARARLADHDGELALAFHSVS